MKEPNSVTPNSSNILRLRGLPFTCTEPDVITFFDAFAVKEVHFVNRNGKPTGEAYVEFETRSDAALALQQRQHEHLGARYVEIFDATEADLISKNIGEGVDQPSLSGFVLRLRGLPFTSSGEDVLEFLSPVVPVGGADGVVFTCTSDCRATGEAYIVLSSEDDQDGVLNKHKELMGARYIEVFKATKGALYFAVHQQGYIRAVDGKRQHFSSQPAQQDGHSRQLPDNSKRRTDSVYRDAPGGFSHLSLGGGRQDGLPSRQSSRGGGFSGGGGGAADGVGSSLRTNPGGIYNPQASTSGVRTTQTAYEYAPAGAPVMVNPYVMQQPYMQSMQASPQIMGPATWAFSGPAGAASSRRQTGFTMGQMGQPIPGTYVASPYGQHRYNVGGYGNVPQQQQQQQQQAGVMFDGNRQQQQQQQGYRRSGGPQQPHYAPGSSGKWYNDSNERK